MEEDMILPVIPIGGFVLFPGISFNFEISRKKLIVAAEEAIKSQQKVLIVAQKDLLKENPSKEALYQIGIIAEIKHIVRPQNSSSVRVLAEGICRGKICDYFEEGSFMRAAVEECEELPFEKEPEAEALRRKAFELFEEYLKFLPKVPPDILLKANSFTQIGKLSDYIASNVVLSVDKKQELLEEMDAHKRLVRLLKILSAEIEILEIEEQLAFELKDSIDKNQHEYILREQIKVIAQELGEDDDPLSEAMRYKEQLKKLKLDKEVLEKLTKECDRFSKMSVGSSETHLSRSYIETCIALPWNKRTKDKIDLEKAKKLLDEQHFGLKEVKDKIMEILAVRKLSKEVKGQIICLIGPPGVGKTSIAKSISQTLGRKYQRISLGGVKDEAEIRGHRRTYIGAMPGRIISAVKQSGVKNPLILLDEIDKMSQGGYNGDPASALLEALDPEQNSTFYDHYIDVPFDLSEVLFITTANDQSKIPAPLVDRMETIKLYSYTHQEKFHIAKNHLIPKLFVKNGLKKRQFSIKDDALHFLIDKYVREAGVRELERVLSSLMKKAALKLVSREVNSVNITIDSAKEILGPEKYKGNKKYGTSEIGIANGLAWTAVGGETMPIEVALMKGKGKLQITGSLGDVMKESAQIAVSYIRSNAGKLGIKHDFYEKTDIHIHAPEGAVPKDGPSAGVTMTTALVSALSGVPVRQNLAMTGEITLKGKVLPIGGLKEKTMAAYREGLESVIIPSENESDLQKIDDEVRKSLKFIMVDDLSAVFKNSLDVDNNLMQKKKKAILNMEKVADTGVFSSVKC